MNQQHKADPPLESKIQAAILAALKRWAKSGQLPRGSMFWKNSASMYSRGGLPDIFALLDGRFFAFEVKRPKVGRATDLQRKTIEQLNEAGGRAVIVTSVEDVRDELERAGFLPPTQKDKQSEQSTNEDGNQKRRIRDRWIDWRY